MNTFDDFSKTFQNTECGRKIEQQENVENTQRRKIRSPKEQVENTNLNPYLKTMNTISELK